MKMNRSIVCLAAGVLAAGAAQAGVVTLGDVPTDVSTGRVAGKLLVGNSSSGSVYIDGGSVLQAEILVLGDQRSGFGTVTVTGAGSLLKLSDALAGALDLGNAGRGVLHVYAGASVVHTPDPSCGLCNVIVGNAAGSTGQTVVSGVGSSFSTTRDLYVASTNVRSGIDGNGNRWFYGTPGGQTQAEVRVEEGGRLDGRLLVVGFDQPDRPDQTGTEVSIGRVVVEGPGSRVNLGTLVVGHSGNGSGTMDVRNGAAVNMGANALPGESVGIAIGSGDGTSLGTLRIDGMDSRLDIVGGRGIVNVGSAANGRGVLEVTGGAVLDAGDNLSIMRIGGAPNSFGSALIGAGSSVLVSSRIGIAHNGTQQTGGTGVLMVDGIASASQVVIGQQGMLGGSGTVLGQVINYGVIAPGNSPGRLTIDGSLDSRGGQIVLEVEQQADGSWRYDELVVTDWLNSLIGDAHVEFAFLGDSDPLTFLNEGMFTLGSFFKQGDGEAGVKLLTDQALGLFIGASFTARSDAYEIRSFRFTVADGASFDIAAIPEPSMLLLVLTALLVAGMRGKPRSRT